MVPASSLDQRRRICAGLIALLAGGIWLCGAGATHAHEGIDWSFTEAADDQPTAMPRELQRLRLGHMSSPVKLNDPVKLNESVVFTWDETPPKSSPPKQMPPTVNPPAGPAIAPTQAPSTEIRQPDPMFKIWQLNADARLTAERTVASGDAHELAQQYPGEYVVVCEAGCRPKAERVVSRVAIAKAKPAPTAAFEPTQASLAVQSAGAKPPAAVAGPGDLECMAGCYAQRPVAALKTGSLRDDVRTGIAFGGHNFRWIARMSPTPAARILRRAATRKPIAQAAYNGAIVGPYRPKLSAIPQRSPRYQAVRVSAPSHVTVAMWRVTNFACTSMSTPALMRAQSRQGVRTFSASSRCVRATT